MSETLENLYSETRQFPPPEALAADANVKADAYERAQADRIAFWEEQARRLTWAKEWDQALDWSNPPFAKWFIGGQLNIAYNCVDRHVEAGRGDKVAIHWEGEPGDTRTITYDDLLKSVSQAANTLTELGIRAGDAVCGELSRRREASGLGEQAVDRIHGRHHPCVDSRLCLVVARRVSGERSRS